ncbi:autotransporter domain-containing protein [Reyranella sp.]|uniref:autotransporter family protein n=1 Tax=Reyranella sp. TaxID=1929291 RepID=UPI0025DD7E5A|nr:autotransporter domain-containing protein [Reyranella sp.]
MADLLKGTCLSTQASRLAFTMLLTAGMLSAPLQANAANFNVANSSQLQNAISNAANGDTITFTANITLSSNLPTVTKNITFNGGNFTLSGNNQHRGLFVQSGTVAINDLNITHAVAQGGKGGDGASIEVAPPGPGGAGGAGLGGALFVGAGAHVAVSNVNLQNSSARGGNGGNANGSFGAGGGGGGYLPAGADGANGDYTGGRGGAGGGGNGHSVSIGQAGGFGGGGGGGTTGGDGGLGGGGGGSSEIYQGTAGFLGGHGGNGGGGGGGGAGLGGALFVQGGGTLIMAGSFTVSGNTVAGGAGGGGSGGSGTNNGASGSGAGSGLFLNANGTITLAPGAGQTQTISDAIVDQTGAGGTHANAGSWSLVKDGSGITTLTGANAYTGGTTVKSGILQGNTPSLVGNIANNAIVVFEQASDGTYAGNITGTGELIKDGAGKLILSGDNNFGAGILVSGGILQGTSNSLKGNISNTATVIFDQAFNGTYAGDMTGAGTLIKNGTGSLNLTGTSTVSGGTTINAGGLAVNGHLTSHVTVNKGGTLSGSGNVTGDITNHGGTVKPGNSIGHLTVNGNFTFNSGTYEVEVNAQGNSDRINVVGAGHKVMINAGTLLIVPDAGTYTPNTTYTIITTQDGGTVKFDAATGGVGFLTSKLSLDRNNIYVTLALAPNAFASAGQTINQQAVGGALDAIAASGNVGGIVTTMANLPTTQGAPALQALSGQQYADFGTLNTRASQLFMNSVGRQMATERGAGLGGAKSVALAEACDVACDTTTPNRFGAWLAGIGSTGSVLGDANASGFTYTMGGTAFGIDYRLDPRFLVGIAGGYTSGTQWVNGFSGNGYSDSFSVAVYGSFTQNGSGPGFYADALAGYANASNRMQRVIALPGNPTGIANGNTSANQFLGQIETGYKFGLDLGANTSISPFARLQIGSINQAGFTEYGGGVFNLAVASQTTTSVRTTFGVDLAGGFDIGGTLLDLGLRLGWMHEFADTARPMTAAFAAAPVSQFTVFGATPQRDSAVIGFSAATALSDRTSLFVSYDGEVGGGTDNHSLRAGFRITW